MTINNKTYQPVQILTIKATGDVAKNRFVGFSGSLCGVNQKAFGVSLSNFSNGSYASIVVLGTATVEAGGTINPGDKVASDALGRAVVATTGAEVNGRALSSANVGELVKILLVP